MEYTVVKIAENIWAIDQKGVRSWLLVGDDKAILVDTCFGGDLLAACRTVTDLPITLITTHADPDHIGSDDLFDTQYLHSAEFSCYESRSKKVSKAAPMEEGDTFSLGQYQLEVVWIPGHTPGSKPGKHGFP